MTKGGRNLTDKVAAATARRECSAALIDPIGEASGFGVEAGVSVRGAAARGQGARRQRSGGGIKVSF